MATETRVSCDVCGVLSKGAVGIGWRRVRLLAPPSLTADVCSIECAQDAVRVLWGTRRGAGR